MLEKEHTPEPISVIDDRLCTQIAAGLERAIKAMNKELGLHIGLTKATRSIHNMEFTVEAAIRSPRGVVMGRTAEAFLMGAEKVGLEASDLGRQFDCGAERFRVVGLKPRVKNPVICERLEPKSDRLFQMPSRVVVSHLRRAKGASQPAQPNTDESTEQEP